jgi:23S rRNA-/tRNA-specific pseudouridylate synthase
LAGHPVLGDCRYDSNPQRAESAERLFLHCHRVEFQWQGQTLEFTSPARWLEASDVSG